VVWQGTCGDLEGTGRELTVSSMGRGSGGASWRPKFLARVEPETEGGCPLGKSSSQGVRNGVQMGVD